MSGPIENVEAALNDLQHRIDRLRVLYEQYFLGMEKTEPTVPRKEVVRIFFELGQIQIRNTALRFRHNTLLQRWNTYLTRWSKTLREIEQGTYDRHLARAQRKGVTLPEELARRGRAAPAAPIDRDPLAGFLDDLDDGGRFSFEGRPSTGVPSATPLPPRPATVPPHVPQIGAVPPPAPRPTNAGSPKRDSPSEPPKSAGPPPPPRKSEPPQPPPMPSVPGMSSAALRTLHERYSAARQSVGESEVKFEALVAKLKKQVPDLLEKHKCRHVDFEVTVRGGKVILQAQPKK